MISKSRKTIPVIEHYRKFFPEKKIKGTKIILAGSSKDKVYGKIKLSSDAEVMDGVSIVQRINAFGAQDDYNFSVIMNNERLVDASALELFSVASPLITPNFRNNLKQTYIPLPRPVVAGQLIEFEIKRTQTQAGDNFVYVHVHYQPKQKFKS